jgi:hypothetical protein
MQFSRGRSGRVKWTLLLLLAVLPLQWFVVAGPLRLHLLAMVVFLGGVLLTHRGRAFGPVLRVTSPFVVANVVLCVIWLGANAYHGTGPRQPLQQLAYLAVLVAVAAVVHHGLALDRGRWIHTMRWAALVVCGSLVGALSISMALNNVNAAAVFGQAIASADPEILQKELFRTAFTGFGFDEDVVRGNLRHEVFGTVLVAMTLSSACAGLRPFTSAGARGLYVLSMAMGATLILLSMSRSIIIAAAIWPLLAVVRSAVSARFDPRLVGGALLGVLAAGLLAATGTLQVLWVRFTQETGSYEVRDRLLEQALSNIDSNFVTGGVTTASASSHNFVLDTWLRAGVFGAVAAVVVLLLLLGLFVSLTMTLHREPAWMLPVTAMLVLPLVRMFTAGGGLIPPVSWVGLGILAGFLTYRRLERRPAAQPARHLRRVPSR